MSTTIADDLKEKSCRPCEKGVPPLSADDAKRLLKGLEEWELADSGKSIRLNLEVKDFAAGMDFLEGVADLAENEGHHPDIHLTGYRNVKIELTTHAIGGRTASSNRSVMKYVFRQPWQIIKFSAWCHG